MRRLYKILPYIGLFFLFFIWNLLIQPLNLDEVWNYGFAHNIYTGLIPYLDFNMIITPFYPMVMALPFFIFGSNMLIFHIEQAVFLTITCYFLFRLFKERTWILLLLFFFPLTLTFPSYNSFLILLYVLVFYLEKQEGNDYIIGLLLGFLILTKQSVGFCLLLPSLYYFADKKKLMKRLVGCFVPLLLFLSYLLVTKSFASFFDLCIMGLFDFAAGNGKISFWFISGLVLIFGTCFYIWKTKKGLYGFYTLAFYSIMIPLFDINHFQLAVFALLMLVFDSRKVMLPPLLLPLFSLVSIVGIFLVTISYRASDGFLYPNSLSHFEYRALDKSSVLFTEEVNDFIKKYPTKEVVFLNSNAYYFKLVNDMPITYLDLINTGNWGYHGSDKMFIAVKEKQDAIFVIDKNDLSFKKQTDKRVLNYIMEKGKKIKTIRIYDFYIIE